MMPVVGQLSNPQNLLVRLTNEKGFISVMPRGNVEIQGVPYIIFHWSPNFNEKEDSPLVPVWLSLPGLPPNYFNLSIMQSIGGGLGRFLKTVNAMVCVTRPAVARICVELDV